MMQQLKLITTIDAATAINKQRRRVDVPSGRLEGTLCISAFVHPHNGDNRSGPTLVELDGVLSDGRSVCYRAVVDPAAFAPQRLDTVTVAQHHTGEAYALAYTPSDIERQSLDVAIHPPVRMTGKYITVNSAVWPCGTESFKVHYSFNSDDARAIAGFLTLQFVLPATRLLWRRAPLITLDGCVPEGTEFVDIELR